MIRTNQTPMIGVTLAQYDPSQGASSPHGPSIGPPMNGARAGYFEMISYAGALPVGIPLERDLTKAATYVSRLDGIVFTGGEDISAAYYGSKEHPESLSQLNPDRDAWEFALLREALQQRRAVLGICRGAELILVQGGSALVQHLPELSSGIVHDALRGDTTGQRWYELAHTLELPTEHRFSELIGSTSVGITSLHHQGALSLGDNRLDLEVLARTEDGVIELFEGGEGRGRILGIQGHAEALIHHALTRTGGNSKPELERSGAAWIEVIQSWVDNLRR